MIFTYGISLLMLLTFLVNSQGVFIEHHNCHMCQPETCEVEMVSLMEDVEDNADCKIMHSCCVLLKEEQSHFSNLAYDIHESCTCFAEYIQLPVFQSEITSYKIAIEESQFSWTYLHIESFTKSNVEKPFNLDQTPPLDLYKEVQQHIVNCTFLI